MQSAIKTCWEDEEWPQKGRDEYVTYVMPRALHSAWFLAGASQKVAEWGGAATLESRKQTESKATAKERHLGLHVHVKNDLTDVKTGSLSFPWHLNKSHLRLWQPAL